jgi:hypothetical protein
LKPFGEGEKMLEALRREFAQIAHKSGLESEKVQVVAKPLTAEEAIGRPKLFLAGFQPRMVEVLSKAFPLRVTDLDPDNIGKEKFGISIEGPEKTRANLVWCDVVLVTGTTIVNNTISEFFIRKPTIFYGVTISGAAKILGLNHFCACSKPR